MSWVRLDDQFANHAKIMSVSSDAFRLHVTAMCWSASQLTDGAVPVAATRQLGWFCTDLKQATAELVLAELWEMAPGGGWLIHDYLEYNPSKEQVLKERAEAKERMQNKRKSSAEVRPNISRTSDNVQVPPSPSPSPSPDSKYVTSTDNERVGVSATPPPKKAPRTVEPGGQSDMFGAIVEACQVDGKLKQSQIGKQSKLLLEAGYTPEQVRAFPEWWKSHDWRGQRGEVPTMPQLAEKIKQSVGTNGSDPSKAKRKMTIVNPFTDERTEVEG
jgi:hypothetical protein